VAPAHWAGEVTARGVAHKSHENCGEGSCGSRLARPTPRVARPPVMFLRGSVSPW